MTESQSAHPEIGDGVACVLDLLNVLMRSLEERLAPPPPPPSLLARIRRLVSGKSVVDQCRRTVCALMRARLGQVAAGLAAAVAADLAARDPDDEASDDLAVQPAFDAPDLETACDVDGAAPCETDVGAPGPDAEPGSTGTVAAGSCDGSAPDIGPAVRSATLLQLLKAGVSRDALGRGEAAIRPASPPALSERDVTRASISSAPGSTGMALCDWEIALPGRVRWQEARGPDDPRRRAFRDRWNWNAHARPFSCVIVSRC